MDDFQHLDIDIDDIFDGLDSTHQNLMNLQYEILVLQRKLDKFQDDFEQFMKLRRDEKND